MIKAISLPSQPQPGRLVGKHLKRYKRILSRYRRIAAQVFMLACALLAFAYCGPLIQLADVTAAPYDPGILSALAFAAAAVFAAWLLARTLTVLLEWELETRMVEPFNLLKPWQRTLLLLGVYCSFFWGFIWVLIALL